MQCSIDLTMPPKLQVAVRDLFRLFSNGSVWAETLRNLRRFHKDKRARSQIGALALLLALMLLVPVAIIAYAAWVIGSGAWIMLLLALPILWWIRRGAKKEFEPQNITPQPKLHVVETDAENQDSVRSYFANLALIYAVLVDRAGSEQFLKTKELPEGIEVTSRRTHLELLKAYGVWDQMAFVDREVLIMPDGSWEMDRINRMTIGMEPLRSLRWILRIDFRLPLVGQQLYGDYALGHELVHNPKKVFDRKEIIEIDILRAALESARLFRVRCFSEAIHRGYETATDENTAQWARELAINLEGNQNEDLILGNQLVSEVSQSQLSWAMALATIRAAFLESALRIVECGQPPDPPHTTIFAE